MADPLPDWPGPPVLRPQTLEFSYGSEAPGTGEALKPMWDVPEGVGVVKQNLVGDPARLLAPLRRGLEIANRLVWPILATMRGITDDFEPLLTDMDVFLWRVELGDRLFQLVLSRNLEREQQWDMVLQASDVNRRDEPLIPILSGFFRPGDGYSDDLQIGTGVLRFPDDRLVGNSNRTLGAVAFNIHEDGRRDLTLLIDDESTSLGTTMRYVLQPDGSGFFFFATQYDALPRRVSIGDERVFQATAWLADRSARTRSKMIYLPRGADAREEVILDECWDADLLQTWIQFTPDTVGVSDGSVENCAPALREMELIPPTPDDQALPSIPGE